jgi:hypothetical protein
MLSSLGAFPSRDVAFAALALLRSRDRVESILRALAEPRLHDLALVIGKFETLDAAHLKRILAETVRQEDAVLHDAAAQKLGAAVENASRAIRKLAARSEWQ